MTDKAKRIRRLIAKRVLMTDAQIARKIGMPNEAGECRVRLERYLMKQKLTGN